MMSPSNDGTDDHDECDYDIAHDNNHHIIDVMNENDYDNVQIQKSCSAAFTTRHCKRDMGGDSAQTNHVQASILAP